MQQLLRRQVTHPACKRHISSLPGLSGLGRAPAPPGAAHSPSLWHRQPVPPCGSCRVLTLTPSHRLLPSSGSEGTGTLQNLGKDWAKPTPHSATAQSHSSSGPAATVPLERSLACPLWHMLPHTGVWAELTSAPHRAASPQDAC